MFHRLVDRLDRTALGFDTQERVNAADRFRQSGNHKPSADAGDRHPDHRLGGLRW
jgi:hypothetical protein